MTIRADIKVELTASLKNRELAELCEAASAAIDDGAGFGWINAPERERFERYWRGVLVIPERILFVGRLDGVIAGSVQLVSPHIQKEAWRHSCQIDTHFVAPWARGYGIARMLMEAANNEAREKGFKVINLSVRDTQDVAIKLYESLGYIRWGTNPKYALVGNKMVKGHFYCKSFDDI